jgi:hypothetical protein
MKADAIIINVFWVTELVLALLAIVLVVAQFVFHWSTLFKIPSVYWPIAKLGFSRQANVRKVFRRLFSRYYRKCLWNPLMNAWRNVRGFDRRRHISSGNIHAVCSAMALVIVAIFLYFAHRAALSDQLQAQRSAYVWALGVASFELVFNAPAIVLSRYLYLLTLRRPGLTWL